MDAIKGQLTPTALASVAFLVLCYWRVFSKSSILPDLPVIGYDQKQWFAWPRTLYFAYNNYRVLYKEAYDKVGCSRRLAMNPAKLRIVPFARQGLRHA